MTWLHGLTESMLPRLLRQADPQHVIEYSLALITVLNEASAGVRAPLFLSVLSGRVGPSQALQLCK